MPPPGQTPCCWSAACHGGGTRNIYKLKATSCGLFASGNVSQNSRPEWDAVSACDSVGKARPTPITNSGSHFPSSPSTGNGIPFQRQIPGRIFRNPTHPEIVSHSEYIQRTLATVAPTSVKKKASRISRLSHLYCFARRTANGEATLPARPSWRLQPCCPGLPWWDGPSRQPSCRAAS